MKLSEVGKAEPRQKDEIRRDIKRTTKMTGAGVQAIGGGYLARGFFSGNRHRGVGANTIVRGAPAGTDRIKGAAYRPSRSGAVKATVNRKTGIYEVKHPRLPRLMQTEGKTGLFRGVAGNSATGSAKKIYGIKTASGAIRAATPKSLAVIGGSTAAQIAGVGMVGAGIRRNYTLQQEWKERSKLDIAERRRKKAELAKSEAAGQLLNMVVDAGIKSHRGHNLRRIAMDEEREYNAQRRDAVEQAAGRGYTLVGNNVYAKNRRFFSANGKVYIEQTVKDNKGTNKKVYVQVKYPNMMVGGETYAHPDKPAAFVAARPSLRNSSKNNMKAAFVATHEMQHVKDFAGNDKDTKLARDAVNSAYRRYPKNKSALKDYATLSAYMRANDYERHRKITTGRYEGGADSAASRKHQIKAHVVSGYPYTNDRDFITGYREGGGTKAPGFSQRRADRKEFKRRANERYGKKK